MTVYLGLSEDIILCVVIIHGLLFRILSLGPQCTGLPNGGNLEWCVLLKDTFPGIKTPTVVSGHLFCVL